MSLSKALARRVALPLPILRSLPLPRAPLNSFCVRAQLWRPPPPLAIGASRWNTTAPPASEGPAGESAGNASLLRRGAVFGLRLIFLYVPAATAWLGLVSGVTLDFRTPEEAKLEEQEAQRVERFFDVDHLPEDDYLREWSCKEQALTGILEKLMRSKTVQDALSPALDRSEMGQGHFIPSGASPAEGDNNEDALEFSYVVPPSEVPRLNSLELDLASEGYRPWNARLILAHSSGSLALVTTTFQHVPPAKGRGELWTCTALRAELIATQGGADAGLKPCLVQQGLETTEWKFADSRKLREADWDIIAEHRQREAYRRAATQVAVGGTFIAALVLCWLRLSRDEL
eukprot:s361_g4.t1